MIVLWKVQLFIVIGMIVSGNMHQFVVATVCSYGMIVWGKVQQCVVMEWLYQAVVCSYGMIVAESVQQIVVM